jgi:hypothetical protein
LYEQIDSVSAPDNEVAFAESDRYFSMLTFPLIRRILKAVKDGPPMYIHRAKQPARRHPTRGEYLARRELHLDRELTWHVYQRHAIVATGRQDFNFLENADTEIIPVCCLKEHRDKQEVQHSRYEL